MRWPLKTYCSVCLVALPAQSAGHAGFSRAKSRHIRMLYHPIGLAKHTGVEIMKTPSACAFVGAIIIGSGWVSLPVAASEARAGTANISSQSNGITAAAAGISTACDEHAHAHASGCTCAHCASAAAK